MLVDENIFTYTTHQWGYVTLTSLRDNQSVILQGDDASAFRKDMEKLADKPDLQKVLMSEYFYK